MEEQLITFETAKLAKEKGELIPLGQQACRVEEIKYPAPAQSLLQRHLREVYSIEIVVSRENSNIVEYVARVDDFRDISLVFRNHEHYDGFETYEDALEKGLYEALKLI